MPSHSATLLLLPEALLLEVVGWSPDGSTAQALLSTCRGLHQLRQDPGAAALLLLRCRCSDHAAALASMGQCKGGSAGVVHQILSRLKSDDANSSGGGARRSSPLAAAAPLQAVLCWASSHGDANAIRALMRHSQSPSVNADGGQALRLALLEGPHLAAMQALLESGASAWGPCDDPALFAQAAAAWGRVHALKLLLLHSPHSKLTTAIAVALSGAGNLQTAELVLPVIAAAGADGSGQHFVSMGAWSGDSKMLRLLLTHLSPSQHTLDKSLRFAAYQGHSACASLLLGWGAAINSDRELSPLSSAMMGLAEVGRQLESEAVGTGQRHNRLWMRQHPQWVGRLRLVRLLLNYGAQVTPEVQIDALAVGCPQLLQLLHLL